MPKAKKIEVNEDQLSADTASLWAIPDACAAEEYAQEHEEVGNNNIGDEITE